LKSAWRVDGRKGYRAGLKEDMLRRNQGGEICARLKKKEDRKLIKGELRVHNTRWGRRNRG